MWTKKKISKKKERKKETGMKTTYQESRAFHVLQRKKFLKKKRKKGNVLKPSFYLKKIFLVPRSRTKLMTGGLLRL